MGVRNRRKQIRRGNSVRRCGGSEASSRNGVHRGGRPIAVRTVCTLMYNDPTGQLMPSPLEAKVLQKFGYNKDNTKPAARKVGDKYTLALRKRQTGNEDGCDLRSRDASLIPSYIYELKRRLIATAVIFNPKPGMQEGHPRSGRKACWKYRESNSSALASPATYSSTRK